MHANQKPRRRHGQQFKAQVLAACAEPGASVSAVALSFGLNDNLVYQWRRGRGYKPKQATAQELVGQAHPEFLALPLPAPVRAPAPTNTQAETIRVELKRGALTVSVAWPIAASSQCAAWLGELLR